MTLDEKKAHVYRLVKLGMSRDEAELLTGLSLEDQETLDRDPVYLANCRVQKLIEERDLLLHLDDIVEDNAIKGVSTEIRWKLERLNPQRWGKSLAVTTPPPAEEPDVPDISKLTKEERDLLLGVVASTLSGEVK